MKKLFLLLALLLLLTGCGKNTVQPPASPTLPTETAQDSTENDSPEFNLVTFDIYAINDLHGKLADTEQQPGVDELSTYLKQAQQAIRGSSGAKKRKLWLYGPVWACGGAMLTALVWLVTVIL